uniref:NADH-ubiquinone oxidoreductase chain 4L n=1 Tax=Urochela quadrinotata TaxID=1176167 RepID=L7NZQ3_UROQU|nr:NADH dehydrogenase subunit 4L [Urochela quadrinotata]AFI54782.1 NADH dehydrogenase subunit 4L [Urochela quadrinotata]
MYLMVFMLVVGMIMFCMNHKHILQTLLVLEYLVLVTFMIMLYMIMNTGYDLFYLLLFLIFTVCEGALGLSILVNMVRSHGNDHLTSMSVLSW